MAQDYLMRQIEAAVRAIGQMVFKQKQSERFLFDEQGNFLEENLLYIRLKNMLKDEKINEAENLLFETIKAESRPEYLQIALEFYEIVNDINDNILEKSNFTRQEIAQGVEEICIIYNLGNDGTASQQG